MAATFFGALKQAINKAAGRGKRERGVRLCGVVRIIIVFCARRRGNGRR